MPASARVSRPALPPTTSTAASSPAHQPTSPDGVLLHVCAAAAPANATKTTTPEPTPVTSFIPALCPPRVDDDPGVLIPDPGAIDQCAPLALTRLPTLA